MKKLLFLSVFIFLFSPIFSIKNLANFYDVKEYILDLNISNTSTALKGNVIIHAQVLVNQIDTFEIDLASSSYMFADSVFVNNTKTNFLHRKNKLIVPIMGSLLKGSMFSVQVYYHRTNITDISIYQRIVNNKSFVISHSQPFDAKCWWPCKQILTDKADSVTFYITTDSSNRTGSNGLLKEIQILPEGKLKYKWQTKYPIMYYGICFSVGPYEENKKYLKLTNFEDSLLYQNFLIKNSTSYQKNIAAIEETKGYIDFFSKLFGTFPYINEKYGYTQIDFPFYGMENPTLTGIGLTVLDTIPRKFNDMLIFVPVHELSHSWFGDMVTCSSWSEIWLNEGIASYCEYLYLDQLQNKKWAVEWINNAYSVSLKSNYSVNIHAGDTLNFDRLFSSTTYKKGAFILHMLRNEINNDSLFFIILNTYLDSFNYSNATVKDFINIAETSTQNDFDSFFDQWYYGFGHPIFNLNWKQQNDSVEISLKQTTSSSKTPLFKVHFELKLYYNGGDTSIRLYQDQNLSTYKFKFEKFVDSIVFEPQKRIVHESLETSILNLSTKDQLYLYPNPSTGIINISAPTSGKVIDLELFDSTGRLIHSQTLPASQQGEEISVDLSAYANGMYLVKLSSGGKVYYGKVLLLK